MMLSTILDLSSAPSVWSLGLCYCILAQVAPKPAIKDGASANVLMMVGILLVLVIIGAVLILLLRRHLLAADNSEDATAGLMENLRYLRDSGQMTVEEYERTRKSMANRVAGRSTGAKRAKSSPAGGGDVTPIDDTEVPPTPGQ